MTLKQTAQTLTLIPSKIQNCIEENKFTNKQKVQAYRIVDILTYNLLIKKKGLFEYMEIPAKYWKKAIAAHYERPMNKLVELGIVERHDSYSTVDHFCKAYRLNPDMICSKLKPVIFDMRSEIDVNGSVVIKHSLKALRGLKIDKVAANRFLKEALKYESIVKRLKFNDEINEIDYSSRIIIEGVTIFETFEGAKFVADILDLDFIQDGRKFIIADKETYIEEKRKHIKFSYSYQLERLYTGGKMLYAKRNTTNSRLDTNLTTIPSSFIDYITLDGERLVSIDLSNSQFVILAYLIEKEGYFDEYLKKACQKALKINCKSLKPLSINELDNLKSLNFEPFTPKYLDKSINKGIINRKTHNNKETKTNMCAKSGSKSSSLVLNSGFNPLVIKGVGDFVEFAKNGGIYEYIQKELNLDNRKRAKVMMFEICFSSHRNRSKAKTQFKHLFPILSNTLDLYKKQNGDNQLAITLQITESEIFIDGILNGLFEKGYKVLSKHDSILCKASEADEVYKFIKDFLTERIGEHQLKRE